MSNVIYGAIFEFTKEKMMDSASDSWKPIVPFIAGGVAAFPNQIFNVPADVVAVRQVASSSNISATSVLRSIYNSEGIFGLYRGVHMSLMLDLKYAAIWWGVYMNAKCWLYKISGLNPDEDRSALFDPYSIGIQASGGVVAGIIAASLTNPLDVVKTVVQTRGKTASFNVDGSKSYASISIQEILKEIMKENGFWGFFRGIRARLIQVPLVSGLSIVGYEFVKRLSLKDPI